MQLDTDTDLVVSLRVYRRDKMGNPSRDGDRLNVMGWDFLARDEDGMKACVVRLTRVRSEARSGGETD